MIWHQPWIWIAAGLVLGIAETLLPGFILLGFGLGAVLTGVLLWIGLLGAGTLPVLVLVFALGSLAGWWGLRRIFGVPGQGPKIWDRDINDN